MSRTARAGGGAGASAGASADAAERSALGGVSAERAFSHGGAEHAKARAVSAGELTGAETAARGASVLQARFEERGGLTRLVSRYHTSPIKIAKAFPLGSGAGVLVMDVSPGMLSGDRYELDWSLGAGASVQISNQSFLKVHPCEEEGGASLRQRFALENGAVCEHLPEPVMLYEDASLLADTEVRLAPGAVWMQTEVLCPGRTLRGEVFRYRRLDNRLTVYADGELIFRQRQRVEPRAQQLAAPGSWHRFTHWGTFCLFGRGADAELEQRLRQLLDRLPQLPGRKVRTGVSRTWRSGIVVQAAGHAAWTVQRVLEEVRLESRKALWSEPPPPFVKSV
ncbi:urease accessory protein UreD [Paenibacillus sp. B01]|uniref:urease accessory protein UreD n=1 Tax=Paenibacillus sp. B01 TaxID=2660554 RepID=UPI00129A5321|nr:urease accessory protein UreD [Paenibacillus sp. B01]QGG57198.1 urease accessory protein UreD [Paenibacillus sp. B01]